MSEDAGVSDRLLSVMSTFIAELNGPLDWRRALAGLMPRLAAELELSRVALFEVHTSPGAGLGVTCRVDWARVGLASLADNTHPPVRPVDADARQRDWAERRTRGEVIEGRTEDLDGYLGAFFRAAGIVSFYTVPVMVEGRWWGHFCLSSDDRDRAWSKEERTAFKACAGLIALAVERSRAGRALSEATRLAMLSAALDAIVTVDEAGQIVDFNPAAEAMFHYRREQVIGRSLGETIVPPSLRSAHLSGMTRYMSGAAPHILGRRIEIQACTSEGDVFPVELAITEIRTEHRRLFTAYLRDISDRVRANEALERLAYTDTVTELPNRAGLVRLVDAEGREPAGALVMRLPDLAILSASLGEDFIGPLMVTLANRLRAHLPADAQLARTGECELALILADHGEPEALGAEIEALLHAPLESEGRRFYLRAEIGIATGPGRVEQILRNAEMASRANRSGRWRVFDESLRADHQHRLTLENALREAVTNRSDELYPVFQPMVDSRTGKVAGFEALARWEHPRIGPVPPADFIPLAEAVGLMDRLGDLIMDRAVKACARWNAGRRASGAPLRYVSVNLAAPQLAAPDLATRIAAILARHGVRGEEVRLELTESALLAQPAAAANVLQQLKALGCSTAIDDFGTGYSSFSYLQHLPVDVLKIDRSFMPDLAQEPRARKIVAVMVDLAHALGMSVVAEGIELPETLREVEAIGCDFVQGFLTGRPMRFEDALVHPDGITWPSSQLRNDAAGKVASAVAADTRRSAP
ncbi:diguanylate cyclase/phosphodiesterase with PAS/PAC and GAF sensor(s) [Ancylobacter novellus DSM 506]|uniref:Diguanylate cyclase/phosphodiesterase with PAS/PAC and GAF sensor(S) n=1 Tax=Ancylobacter novellus (strain ATCC 8093 / DSM 506 / JCM 20403 / CCM 1077 / IAM 12100 / NBRC 12443 / NCIMB 10456) TaxID=639283 RepID=D7A4E8_ANCN5|nr:EAL domain-containing protein [Ancylobacter novellus]ADH89811.1 diguanylate cyclase/phosphodiesterase with PAS/PAC and GAF sensor(s) [Ancylobacter novellus DSM 506]